MPNDNNPIDPTPNSPFVILFPSPKELLRRGEFPCIQCGACCRIAHKVPQLKEAGYTLPRNEACQFLLSPRLTDTHESPKPQWACSIYPVRPPVCRVSSIRLPAFSKIQWYLENLFSCRALVKELGDYPQSTVDELEELISLINSQLSSDSQSAEKDPNK